MLRIIIVGVGGLMGRAIAGLAAASPDQYTVVAGADCAPNAAPQNVPIFPSIFDIQAPADVVIDFSRPGALPATLSYAKLHNLRAVIGTTGLTSEDYALIGQYAHSVPIFCSGNMSLGVNLQIELARRAAATLGDSFEVEIVEKHHHFKADAPSGTALMLADGISAAYTAPREYVFGRHSRNQRRQGNEIGIHAVRGGTVVGEHEVLFLGTDEVIEINHRAYSKQVFAAGALRIASFMMDKAPGLYDMKDIVTEANLLTHLYTVPDQAAITLSGLPNQAGVLDAVFSHIAQAGVNVDMISLVTTAHAGNTLSFSLNQGQLTGALAAIEPLKAAYPSLQAETITGLVKLTVSGSGMPYRHGVAATLFEVLAAAGINVMLVTTSETKIAYCVKADQVQPALTAMSEKLGL